MGIYKRKDPDGHFVAYKKFRDDPAANPLKPLPVRLKFTPAAGENRPTWELEKDETISPLPAMPPHLTAGMTRTQHFPLQLFGFHFKARTHSSYGNVDVLKAACRQEVWLNPSMPRNAD
jgi:Tat-targeted selenate reductase subunit YnfE